MCVYHKIQVVNKHYRTSGYTAVGRHVDIEVTHGYENVKVSADIAQGIEECWNIEQQQQPVCVNVCM